MKGGILEVLLVSAEGLKDAHMLGSSNQYVVLQCGSQTSTSKISLGKERRAWWNEKFVFKLSSLQWKESTQLRLRIMDKDKFMEDRFIGEATVYLRGILREGGLKGSIELKPAPYNVVLEDGTYEGELKVGIKFISNVEMEEQAGRRGYGVPAERQTHSIYRAILDLTLRRISWPKLFFFRNHADPTEIRKDK